MRESSGVSGSLSNTIEFGKEDELAREAQFKTVFRVYVSMLRLRKATPRDVQRVMGFATPSQARYHLKKLSDYGLVAEDEPGSYRVVSRRFGMLRFYLKTRRWMIPLSLFYMIVFAALTVVLFARTDRIELLFLGSLMVAKQAIDTYSFFRTL